MLLRRAAVVSAAVMVVASALPAQGGTRKHEDAANGFRLKVPRALEQQPLEPLEEQILAKFSGKQSAKWQGEKRDLELTLWVARIKKQKQAPGKTTEEKPEKAAARSLREQERERLNGGATIEEFLQRRSIVSQKRLRNTIERPVKSWAGHPFDVYEVSSAHGAELAVRAFTVETDADIFGLFALGYVEAFEAQVAAAARSLERFVPERGADGAGVADVYTASTLRDIPRRERVRKALIDGWEAFDTENFILVTNIRNKRLVDDMLADLEMMRTEYLRHFPPVEEITAVSTVRVCASYEEYLAYGAPPGTGGYWHPIDEELVVFDPGKKVPDSKAWLKQLDPKAVLYHEAMHQYLHYANRHVAPAPWFNEGYGEYFGGARVARARGEITRIDKHKFRMAWVKSMQKQGAWPGLRDLLRMPQNEFYAPFSALQNYAMGWAFCYFLEQEREKQDGERRNDWALIPSTYLQNLRMATLEHLKKMPKDAPKDWIQTQRDEIQSDAYDLTFGSLDLDELRDAWIAAMKKW
jgi:hypothetical protein